MNRIHHTAPEHDLSAVRDITIVGAGPVGLSAAFWAGMRESSSRIIDSLPQVGGQLTTLYPEKWIFDVPGYPRILAKDLVENHRRQTLEQFDVPVHLDTTAQSVSWEGEGDNRLVVLQTDRGELRSRAVIISGGHGAFEPKKLPGYDLGPWEGRGVHYVVGSKHEFAGKRVLIIGGGDSALDWVVNLLDTADHLSLAHRREGFRAHEATVSEVTAAVESGDVALHVPFQIREVIGSGAIEAVRLFHSETDEEIEIEIDTILPQLGFKTALGPLKDWGFEIEKGSICVSPTYQTALERIWACGDITTFEGKLKLIATGYAEAAVAVAQAIQSFRPEMKLQPGFSTNTGVPGAVTGQP